MVCLLFLCFWMVLGLPGPGGTQHTHTAQRTAHTTGHSTAALHHSAQHVVKGTAKQLCTRQTAHTHTLLYMSARVAEGGRHTAHICSSSEGRGHGFRWPPLLVSSAPELFFFLWISFGVACLCCEISLWFACCSFAFGWFWGCLGLGAHSTHTQHSAQHIVQGTAQQRCTTTHST